MTGTEETEFVGENDEYGNTIAAEQLESLQRQKELIDKAIEDKEKGKANFEQQWAVDDELWRLRLEPGATEVLKPDFKYQTSPRYAELVQKKTEFSYRQDKYMAEAKLVSFDRELEELKGQRESINEKIAKMQGGA